MASQEADLGHARTATSGFAALLTKLRPPRSPLALVERTSLVEELLGSRAPLIVVSAPAGSG
jgi:ATP/maltotriose-dependent transcriptional regulator MalT